MGKEDRQRAEEAGLLSYAQAVGETRVEFEDGAEGHFFLTGVLGFGFAFAFGSAFLAAGFFAGAFFTVSLTAAAFAAFL
ncbi:hypothetical protein DIM_05550 [Candidatus Denitrolinea symbiosum]|nr:hypothetical protein DIM_05550 [Candidatus Denitrolinea symbiosum]